MLVSRRWVAGLVIHREFHGCLKHLATSTCSTSNGMAFVNSGVTQAMPFQESTKSLRTCVPESRD